VGIVSYKGMRPRLAEGVFIAPGAWVAGDVEIGAETGVWFNAVVRADVNFVRIGCGTNIQDCAVVHVSHRTHPTRIGDGVVIGHGAVLHGCTVEDGALIGIRAVVLDGARIGAGSIVAAGAVVPPGMDVPPGMLVMGVPGKVVRPVTEAEIERTRTQAERYRTLREAYLAETGA